MQINFLETILKNTMGKNTVAILFIYMAYCS